jgi:hypothetical protein
MPLFDELRHAEIQKNLMNFVRRGDRSLHRSLAIVKLYRSVAPYIGSDDAEYVVLGPWRRDTDVHCRERMAVAALDLFQAIQDTTAEDVIQTLRDALGSKPECESAVSPCQL